MKKIIIFSIMILTLGFAASSLSISAEIPGNSTAVTAKSESKITIGGELRVRGVTQQNTNDFDRHSSSGGSGSAITTKKEQPRPKQ